MSEKNVEVVRQLYEAWNRGDLQSVLKPLTSDFEFRTAGIFPDLDPVYQGREGFRELWESFREGWEVPVAVERIEPVGDDRVLALLRYQARGRGGVEVKREYAQVVTLEDGMVSRIVGFADQEAALEAAGLSE